MVVFRAGTEQSFGAYGMDIESVVIFGNYKFKRRTKQLGYKKFQFEILDNDLIEGIDLKYDAPKRIPRFWFLFASESRYR